MDEVCDDADAELFVHEDDMVVMNISIARRYSNNRSLSVIFRSDVWQRYSRIIAIGGEHPQCYWDVIRCCQS